MTDPIILEISHRLTNMILHAAQILANEQKEPHGDVDRSEEYMTCWQKRLDGLRKIRDEFETLITGVV